jgi:putative FmdB family regulatory protein
MPVYEYLCDACGKEFEEMQKFSDTPIDKCPRCGGHSHRLISHSTFVLKGTGWYVTDYANKGKSSGITSGGD